jgi:polar amino acid transport system substrate-binding protein
MKKVLPVALILSVAVLMSACANPDDEVAPTEGSDDAVAAAPTGIEPDFEIDEELAALVPDSYQGGSVQVAVNPDVPPVKFVDEDGNITGLTVQLVTAASQMLGLEAEMVQSSFDGLIPGLTGDRYDMILSIGAFKERQELVDFIDYMTQSSTITIKTGSDFADLTPQTLCGQRVAFMTGTQEDGLIETENQACIDRGEDEISAFPYGESAAAYLALASGQTDAVWGDSTPAYYNARVNPSTYEIVHADFVGPYGIAFRKDEEGQQLREAFHQALQKLVEDGWYDELFTEWGMEEQELPELPINSGPSING